MFSAKKSAISSAILAAFFVVAASALAEGKAMAPDNTSFPPDTPSVILSWPASAPYLYTLRVIDQTDSTARSGDSCGEHIYLCESGINVTALSVPVVRNHSYIWSVTPGWGNAASVKKAHFAIARPILDTELVEAEPQTPAIATIFVARNGHLSPIIYGLIIAAVAGAAIALNRWIASKLPEQEMIRINPAEIRTHTAGDITEEKL